MSIQFGVYDFFAYAVPGGLYLLLFAYILASFTEVRFDFLALRDLSLVQTLAVVAFAYVVGLVVERVAVLWYRIFEPEHLAESVLDGFKKRHPGIEFKFQGSHWPILIAYLRKEGLDTTTEIHRFNAIHIMLKNASFGFMLLSVVEMILFIRNTVEWAHLIASVGAIVSSVLAARQAVRFKRWFFSANFEAVIARGLRQDDLVTKRDHFAGLGEEEIVSSRGETA